MNPPYKFFGSKLKEMISSPYFQGVTALAGLIAAIASDNPLVRIPALLILLGFLLALRPLVWPWIRNVFNWLTWKFALGLTVGIIAGALLIPLLEPIYNFCFSLIALQVEVLDSTPKNGESIHDVYSRIEVNFSERIPPQYQSRWFIKVKVTPYIPVCLTWIYNYDFNECCRTLYIYPNKFFPNTSRPHFEPNTTYHMRISGVLLKNNVNLEFRTPPQ